MLLFIPLADEFEKYCSDVEDTAAWGGQLEVSKKVGQIRPLKMDP